MTVINLPDHDRREGGAFQHGRVGGSIDEPVTGPLPVTDLAEGHVHVTERRGVVIVALDGALDEALVSRVLPALDGMFSDAEAVILDIDHVTLLDRSALDAVLGALDTAPSDSPRCLIAGRLSGRMVLDRWSIATRLAIFSSVADALQARAFAASGYGTGWTPTPISPGDPSSDVDPAST